MLNLARQVGVPTVLTNAVRHATPDGAVTVDVLDAARRLVAIDSRHLDRTTSEGYLTGEAEMALRAHEIAEAAGDLGLAGQLLALTESLASRCLMPNSFQELGLNAAHLPEPEVLGLDGKDPVPSWNDAAAPRSAPATRGRAGGRPSGSRSGCRRSSTWSSSSASPSTSSPSPRSAT